MSQQSNGAAAPSIFPQTELPIDGGSEREHERVDIRPGVSILSVLRHLNYRPWFALAEFVDNSLQSYLDHRGAIEELDGAGTRLRVSIEVDALDEGRIIIRDNAAGIGWAEYARAFRPAALPPEAFGLNEFGMGMKSAACWFAPRWHVRTSALGEPVERTVRFDVKEIVVDSLEELVVSSAPASPSAHYTEIVLHAPYKLPRGRTVSKIKEHLADIYRVYTRSGVLALSYDGSLLDYEAPRVLMAPPFDQPSAEAVVWKKEIDFDFGEGLRAHGFAALRETGSTRKAGFALFRRNRLIQGSGEDGYRPRAVFGSPNGYAYQRLFGELHLEGFEVSHTKDGFRWDENEEPFLDLLREHIDSQELPLLRQAKGHRPTKKEVKKGAEEAAESTATRLREDVPGVLDGLGDEQDEVLVPEDLPLADIAARRTVEAHFHDEDWEIVIELTSDPSVGDWLSISDSVPADASPVAGAVRRLGLRLSLAHPFMVEFGGTRASDIEPLLRVAAGIGLAEQAARDAGIKYVGRVRANLNEILREGLSKR